MSRGGDKMKPTDNGIHHIHYIKTPPRLIVFTAVLSIIMIAMLICQQKQIDELRIEATECRSAWMKITGEKL